MDDVRDIFLFVLTWIMLGFVASLAWNYRRVAKRAISNAQTALDLLSLMDEAHDPGRDVHERLARAFEATLIAKEVDGPPRSDPAARRAAAMGLAAHFIEVASRANLTILANDEDDEEDTA